MGKDVKETLIVKSKVREYVKSLGDFNVSGDFLETLNQQVGKIIKHAAKRTEANSRKTVAARDI